MLLRRPTPCKGCEERNETCHSTCKRYKEFAEGLHKEKSNIVKKQMSDRVFFKTVNERKRKKFEREVNKKKLR